MIEKLHQFNENDQLQYRVICDVCKEEAEFTVFEWSELMEAMKDEAWTTKKRDGEWIHHCAKCTVRIQERLSR
jgi:aerobic-type carbon monoxide dehydrogenase small subunit (CoxS/CutS family)